MGFTFFFFFNAWFFWLLQWVYDNFCSCVADISSQSSFQLHVALSLEITQTRDTHKHILKKRLSWTVLGNSSLLLLANCTEDRGKFYVLIETCAQCHLGTSSAFNAHHVPQQACKSHRFCVVLSHFQSWSCPSELPEVSLGFTQEGSRSRWGACLSSDSAGSEISYWILKGLLSPLLWWLVPESERAEQVATPRGMSGLHIHGCAQNPWAAAGMKTQ